MPEGFGAMTQRHSLGPCKPSTILLVIIVVFVLSFHSDAGAISVPQRAVVSLNQPIPQTMGANLSYESWSLFLICNPQWLVSESEARLKTLYDQFQAFGGAIGPRHLAVWFSSPVKVGGTSPEVAKIYEAEAVDVERSSAFCSFYDLPLSKSPYVVVTTDYPGEGIVSSYPDTFRKPENSYVLSLNGMSASEAIELLTLWADKIVAEKLFDTDPHSEDFWRTWERTFRDIRSGVLGFSKRVRISFHTKFFKVEIEPQ
jgi:hypothetical protein